MIHFHLDLFYDIDNTINEPTQSNTSLTHFINFSNPIPDFGVSTTILNTIDISRTWCNFGPLQGQVKSCHFPEMIDAKRQFFL